MQFYQNKFSAMGSPCALNFYCSSPVKAQQIFSLVIKEVKRLEDKYSRYLANSLLSKINTSAGIQKVKIDHETFALLAYAEQAYQISDGLFDITTGVLRHIWDFKKQQIPSQIQIENSLQLVDWQLVEWQQDYIYLPVKGMEIDFGGIVKEYAADAVAALLKSKDIKHGLIDLGGDIHVLGPDIHNKPWPIAIRSPQTPAKLRKNQKNQTTHIFEQKQPEAPQKALANIAMTHGGLASSGDYERNFIVKGKKYSHLLHPKTGWPVHGLSAVSVWCEQCVMAGTIATISMLKQEEGIAWLNELEIPYVAMDHVGGTYQHSS
ncbi:FAD:protein FMN transferase [Colwellia sp. E2M01]|uniref:FAD:protein FMN transferase n=1 Tax=Colwellia sp. E2M01 TaxID=2841561 RepID=UPI001C085B81|nr:FAD:protein FMN transferase [Colwellia sp. E2M01]MBU2870670.1 FAD:protein FMN transferase [Colwellia sp. E2M01]